jgi:hypothetical protein
VYTVTDVSAGSMPAPAAGWFKKAPPATPIVRADVRYRGDRAVAYLWFTRHGGGPLTLVARIASLLPAGANLDKVRWGGREAGLTAIPAGRSAQYLVGDGNRLVTYMFGLASSPVVSAVVTPLRGLKSIDALSGPVAEVPGLIIGGHGFPGKVFLSAFPSTPTYGALVVRDAAGKAIGTGRVDGVNAFSYGDWCMPLAVMDRYQAPSGGFAFSTGAALPLVASVTAVLPDGSQLKARFSGHPEWRQPYYRGWQVRYPRQDGSLIVRLVFRDAAGRVLGQVKTIPGESPYAADSP